MLMASASFWELWLRLPRSFNKYSRGFFNQYLSFFTVLSSKIYFIFLYHFLVFFLFLEGFIYIVLWSVGILLCYFFEFLGALVAFLFFGGNIFLWLLT